MEDLPVELGFEVKSGVALLSIRRPDKRNALTTRMCEILRDIMAEVKSRDDIRVTIITGTGPAFCAGSDAEDRLLPRMVDDRCVPLEKTRGEMLDGVMLYLAPAFLNAGKPTIAAINGVAAGSGLSLALTCDIRLASDKAKFVASWVNVALTPDCGATYTLPRLVGVDRALKMFFTGDPVDAREAERIGLVTEVIRHDDLAGRAMELAERIAAGPSVAIELTKRAAHRGIVSDFTSQLYFENYAQDICFMSKDFREGVTAFKEKRKPKFIGG